VRVPTAAAKRGFFYDAAFTHTMMSLRHAAPGNTGPLTPQSLGSRSRAPRPRPSAPASFPPAAIILSTKLVAVGNSIHSRDVGPCEAGRTSWGRWRTSVEVPVSDRDQLYPLDRRVWLLAIGRRLRVEYDAIAEPVPPGLATLVKQLEMPAQGSGQEASGSAMAADHPVPPRSDCAYPLLSGGAMRA
jgi:hypothetical protein